MIHWIYPPTQDFSDHQGSYIFSRESQPKPSFVTVTWIWIGSTKPPRIPVVNEGLGWTSPTKYVINLHLLGGGFKYFFIFTPIWGRCPIWRSYFSDGWFNHQLDLWCFQNMGVSKNRGTTKSSILIGFSIINHPFWGTIICGNTQFVMSWKKKPWGLHRHCHLSCLEAKLAFEVEELEFVEVEGVHFRVVNVPMYPFFLFGKNCVWLRIMGTKKHLQVITPPEV